MDDCFHALILTGATEQERRERALELSAGWLCGKDEVIPCLACPTCRRVLAGVHLDVHLLQPEKSAVIEVKRVRDLREELQKTPHEGCCKVAIIDADALNVHGQNALLATLEEPPEEARFILLSERPMSLLPTVRSRCVTNRLPDSQASGCERISEAVLMMNALLSGDEWAWMSACYALDKKSREEMSEILDGLAQLLIRDLGKQDVLTARRFGGIIDGLRRYQDMLASNVGVGHICGALSAILSSEKN